MQFHAGLRIALGLILALPLAQASAATCRFDQAEYRDVTNKGFRLQFSPHKDSSVPLASVVLSHEKRGRLSRFDVLQSNGYSVIHFEEVGKKPKDAKMLEAYFFDENLGPDHSKGAAPYIFIPGLGLADYYRARDTVPREQLIEDAMWKLAGCGK